MIKVLSLFSGIGAFEKALENLHIKYELVGFSEIDKYAVKSYCAIHGVDESMNLGDITKIDGTKLPKDIDLLTYGFPCQDISLAGKQKGLFNEDGSQTRSGLFFEALRLIEDTKPKIAIAENVKNLVGKKFNAQFQVVLASLESAGYNNYYKVLNAKDYGVPQNRERVFIVSIRKDIDTGAFWFPKPYPLTKRLKDVLEDVVDESFYLNNEQIKRIKSSSFAQEKLRIQEKDYVDTLLARDYKDPKCVQIGNLFPSATRDNPNQGRLYDTEGLSPTLGAMQGGNRQPFVPIPQATKKGYTECEVGGVADLSYPNSKTRRGRVQEGGTVCPTITAESNGLCRIEPVACAMRGRYDEDGKAQQEIELSDRVYANALTTVQKDSLVAYDEQNGYVRKDGCVGTIMTDGSSPKKNNRIVEDGIRIRKLTPKECFRLMDFDDGSFNRAKWLTKEETEKYVQSIRLKQKGKKKLPEGEVIERMSDTQLYKQAGNSIVVSVIEEIYCMMFDCRGRLRV